MIASHGAERVLILAPRGRDAVVAENILRDARIPATVCGDLGHLLREIKNGADLAIITEEAIRDADLRAIAGWVASQLAWSDFPFILLTEHGGGLERNPSATQLTERFGNVTFLERPFHPTTLISVVETGLRSRARQHECRRLNEELELRVQERTSELAAANRQLLSQIEERERVESTLRQMQRLEAVGQLTSGVAHDFNNLLTVVLGNIGFVEKELAEAHIDGKVPRRLAHMRMAAERGAKLTDQLLSFSRRARLEPRVIDVNNSITSMGDLLRSTMGGSIQIETRLGESSWPAMVDPTQLELAVLNLAINARDAMTNGGTLTIRTGNVELGPPLFPEEPAQGQYVMVCVADTGCGMSNEVRSKAFEPFFTTKGVGKGSGLGLSQVLGFAKQTGGGIRLDTRPNEGTAIYIYLPRAEATASLAAKAPHDFIAADQFRGALILLVDDDDAVREVTAAMLRDMGYSVVEAGSGGAALDAVDHETRLDLMLLDFAMPGMNGAEVAREVQAKRPSLPILFVTGFADRAALAGINDAVIVGKPFVDDELTVKLRQALAQGGLRRVVGAR